MKIAATLLFLFVSGFVHAEAVTCNVLSNSNVLVLMKAPHPEHALVNRPDGEVVWLQTGPEYIHKQIENFGALEEWVIAPETKGTVWLDGKAEIQPIIKGSGRYHLYIANNIETEPGNTHFIECYFVINRQPITKGDENRNPRFAELNPYAWKGLPMEVVIVDFQESDGIFSSFICDEINRRLSGDLSGTLQAMSTIDKKSRINAFNICFHPESEGPLVGLKAISLYSKEYPDLVNEITGATEK